MNDIAEVRLGTHSIGFVRTSCTDKFREVRACAYTARIPRVTLPLFIRSSAACLSRPVYLYISCLTYAEFVRCTEMQFLQIRIHNSTTFMPSYLPFDGEIFSSHHLSNITPNTSLLTHHPIIHRISLTSSHYITSQCISIIGTEAVFDVQLANENARDVFAAKFRIFVMCKQAQRSS